MRCHEVCSLPLRLRQSYVSSGYGFMREENRFFKGRSVLEQSRKRERCYLCDIRDNIVDCFWLVVDSDAEVCFFILPLEIVTCSSTCQFSFTFIYIWCLQYSLKLERFIKFYAVEQWFTNWDPRTPRDP